MLGDPYCGNCHTWMTPRYVVEAPGCIQWTCECPMGLKDTTKDPNCHNSSHAHYDPLSPIVLSRKAGERAEEEATDELDEILEDTNQQVWSRTELQARWDGFWYVRDQDDPTWDTDSRINIAFTKFLDWLSAEED